MQIANSFLRNYEMIRGNYFVNLKIMFENIYM